MKQRRTQNEIDELRDRIVAELTAKPQPMRPLCLRLGLGHRTGEKHFDALKLHGRIDFFGHSNSVLWATKAVADAENKRRRQDQARQREAVEARLRKVEARRRELDAQLDAEIERGTDDWKRTIRRVPAEAVRAEILGPCSVWDLAA